MSTFAKFLLSILTLSVLIGCSTPKKSASEMQSGPLDLLLKEDSQKLTEEEIEKLVHGQLTVDIFRKTAFSAPKNERQIAKMRYRLARWLKHFLHVEQRDFHRTLK